MAREQKITDEQVNRHLSEGMSQKAIAELYDMQPAALSARIKKMREQGRLQIENASAPEQSVKKMDTVVRLSDRRWFRVMEVKEQEAVLKATMQGEFTRNSKTITVPLEELSRAFEKKDYPEVRCYTVSELEEKAEGVTPEPEPAALQTPEQESEPVNGCSYIIEREYLERIDTILTAVGIAEVPEETAIRTKQLITQILNDGIREERNRVEAQEQ